MSELKIKKLLDLMQEYKGHKVSIINQRLTNLTAPGDNYFSTMIRVEATIRNEENGDEKKLHAVAKSAEIERIADEAMLKWAIPLCFKKEYKFCTEILPTLKKFQRDNGVEDLLDFFPQLFSARLNLNGSDIADRDAVIFLENLVENGYSNTDRHVCFDLLGAEGILKDLAAFHAVTLALKLENPQLYEEKINFNCKPPEIPPNSLPKTNHQVWLDILQEYDSCAPYLSKYSEKIKEKSENVKKIHFKSGAEPFATLIHNDLWINNIMQKTKKGKVIKNKIMDLQAYTYGSPAHDVTFFLYTSVQTDVLRLHFEDLLTYYHERLLRILKKFKCDTTPFCYERYIEEVRQAALDEAIGWAPFMMFPIFGEKGAAADLTDLMKTGMTKENIPQIAIDRVRFIVEDLGQRGWL